MRLPAAVLLQCRLMCHVSQRKVLQGRQVWGWPYIYEGLNTDTVPHRLLATSQCITQGLSHLLGLVP